MKARQNVILEPYKAGVREVDLPAPAANQVLVAACVSAVSAGTELAVYTGTHQWLRDPSLPDWKFPFRPGYSAAGRGGGGGAAGRGGGGGGGRLGGHGLGGGGPGELPGQPRLGRAADAGPRARPALAPATG